MTLGGLALAVGVLVDEATVEIENIHTQMLPGVSRARAVVEACSRTAMARLLSMLCILAVFVPSFFMVGVGAATVCAAVAGGRIFHDRVLSFVQQPGSGILGLADAGSSSREEGRDVRALRSVYERYLHGVLRFRWPLVIVYLVRRLVRCCSVLLPQHGDGIVP